MSKQSKYKPNYVSPPGETLQDLLEQHNLTQADLAERTGRPKKTINEIIQGKTAITPETAVQLQHVLKTPAHFWLAREAQYRAWLAEKDDDDRLKGDVQRLREFPIKEMVKSGWIQHFDDQLSQLKELLMFFGVTSIDRIPTTEPVAFRKSEAFATNPWALAAWLRQGELDCLNQVCQPFDKAEFLKQLKEIRLLTNEAPASFVPKLISLCNKAGVCLVFTKELPNTSVCGATRWITSERALLQLSLRYKSNDHFWFSFFHEAAHIYLGHAKREILLENAKPASLDQREVNANNWANDLLIPKEHISTIAVRPSEKQVRQLAAELKISPAIIVGRLQHESIIGFSQLNGLKTKLTWEDWPVITGTSSQ